MVSNASLITLHSHNNNMQEHATACGKRQGTKQQGRRMIQPEDIQYTGIYNII